jgi:hypothetical protein
MKKANQGIGDVGTPIKIEDQTSGSVLDGEKR